MSKKTRLTKQIEHLLFIRHPQPEWAVFVELIDGVGGTKERTIDVFAFNTYPSKRFWRVAYEVKSSRSDFLAELRNPAKRMSAERLSDQRYFATPPGIVQRDELPEGWGLIEMAAPDALRIKVRAPKRESRNGLVWPLPLEFAAAMIRRSSDRYPVLPASIWKYEGKEIPFDELKKAADWAVREHARLQVEKARREMDK